MLRAFLTAGNLNERCASLRYVLAAGEALPSDLARDCLQSIPAPLFNIYGPHRSFDLRDVICVHFSIPAKASSRSDRTSHLEHASIRSRFFTSPRAGRRAR